MSDMNSRPRPLALAAAKRSPLALIGSLPAGGGLLSLLALGGVDIGYLDVLAAVAVTLATAIPSLAALRGVVAAVEPIVTPNAAPRSMSGERLVPQSAATMAQALTQARVARAEPKRPPPGRSEPQPWGGPEPGGSFGTDWTGEGVAEQDEARARGVAGTAYYPSHREGTPRRDGRSGVRRNPPRSRADRLGDRL